MLNGVKQYKWVVFFVSAIILPVFAGFWLGYTQEYKRAFFDVEQANRFFLDVGIILKHDKGGELLRIYDKNIYNTNNDLNWYVRMRKLFKAAHELKDAILFDSVEGGK